MNDPTRPEPREGVRFVPPRLSPTGLITVDAAVAGGYVAVSLIGLIAADAAPDVPAWMATVVIAVMGAAAAVRRWQPRAALVVVAPLSVVGVWFEIVSDPLVAAAAVLYVVALVEPVRSPRVPTVVGVLSGLGLVLAAISGPVGSSPGPVYTLLIGLALCGGAWALGRAMRDRREQAAQAAGRQARQAVIEERLRIARELHDVVAHSMSVITVSAGIANHVVRERPEQAAHALQVIESTGRGALDEMRQLLGVLRSDVATAEPEAGADVTGAAPGNAGQWLLDPRDPSLSPAPGLAQLPELAERARLAGVDVELEVDGVPPLPPGLELTVYRIVQEALTNVVRHAAPAACWVRVLVEDDHLVVEVRDDGPGPLAAGGSHGHGLLGLRERVAVYGGVLSAGPGVDVGFVVTATLPCTAVTASNAEPLTAP
ncbi:sensor histidine kinase [Phytoactinopolyspora limicola]|uniref:sensor histidine kinase n=1 Tax=Phytoactinopolyspora limicola TaxID=2715536 RepID=UPI001A9C6539|nr:histidine kinase [Phytoactinopolyspora limicola]